MCSYTQLRSTVMCPCNYCMPPMKKVKKFCTCNFFSFFEKIAKLVRLCQKNMLYFWDFLEDFFDFFWLSVTFSRHHLTFSWLLEVKKSQKKSAKSQHFISKKSKKSQLQNVRWKSQLLEVKSIIFDFFRLRSI